MGGFLNRYLPAIERRTALWLVLGGAVVLYLSGRLYTTVRGAVPVGPAVGAAPAWAPYVIAASVQFAFVALLVAALVRFARAPKALALYLVLGAVVSVLIQVISLPLDYADARLGWSIDGVHFPGDVTSWWRPSAERVLDEASLAIGALAGAWIAATVSLARIRDVGFSGDEPDGHGLRARSGSGFSWSFIAWEGWPAEGDSLIAVAFIALRATVDVAGLLIGLVAVFVPGRMDGGAVAVALSVLSIAVLAAVWLAASREVVIRTGVVSAWLIALGGVLASGVWVLESLVTQEPSLPAEAASIVGVNLAGPFVVAAAALAGTELALRRRAATLPDTPVMQDPDAHPPAPDDTAGG